MLRLSWLLALVFVVGCKSAAPFAKALATAAVYTAAYVAAAALNDLANGRCYRASSCADDETCDRESHQCVPIEYSPVLLQPFDGCHGDPDCEREEREAIEEDERLQREAAERAAASGEEP